MSASSRPEPAPEPDLDPDTDRLDDLLDNSGERAVDPLAASATAQPPERIAARYRVERVLGRGGMAVVYLVEDGSNGRMLALKQLAVEQSHRHFQELAALFEREYHTLVQLSHPRIVEVYDFGLDGGPFYTMELLEGGDLRERAPLPWKDACTLIHDVCSTLALLHSRRLVHRDVSPRNVRSAHDGSAKLIDFGALAPMGPTAQIVGTAPFVPPEVLHRSALDARTDLYSLGATFYFALTGRLAYPARDFGKLPEVWAVRPPPPSSIVADIPPALDVLVMALIALDPAVRPRSAFEVMQRLCAIAGLPRDESLDVSQAYLSMPVMVGRDDALALLRARIKQMLTSRGGAMSVQGPAGIGRSRMLDACALEGKTAGAMVLRVNASLGDRSLALVEALAAQLIEALPDRARAAAELEQVGAALFEPGELDPLRLRPLGSADLDRATLQKAMCRWLLRVAEHQPLLILVDDLHKADEASLALLAALICANDPRRLLLVTTHESGALVRAPDPFDVLQRYADTLALTALSRAETEMLFNSVFGDVPNLGLLSDRIYRVAVGNPRESMELAQWLVTKQSVRYEGGSWSLPGRLELAELPHNLQDAFKQRLARLSQPARYLVEAHALSLHPTLERGDYARLARHAGLQRVDDLIGELLAQQIVTSQGLCYVLSHRAWSDAARAGLDQTSLAERHCALAVLYDKGDGFRYERAHHLLLGGREALGLDLVIQTIEGAAANATLSSGTTLSADQLGVILARALDSAETLVGRPQRDAYALRRALASMSIATDDAYYFRVQPLWFERLSQDSGLALYEALGHVEDPSQRLMQALTRASEVYQNTPEAERVYSPEVAIKGLVYYTLVTIALGSRTQASELLIPLPSVLEPFAALSPVIAAVCKNALATRESSCDALPERALVHWGEVQAALTNVSTAEMPYVVAVRAAVWYGIGLIEARLGMKAAEERATLLDKEPSQQVSAMALRKITRLNQGDFEGAERCRKKGEALSLLSPVRQMFSSTLTGELTSYALASDLVGIRQVGEALKHYLRYPGWLPWKHLADGYFEQTRGELSAAREAFERGLALSQPDPSDPMRSVSVWPRLEAAYLEVLVALGLAHEAKTRGELALLLCRERQIVLAAFPIQRALALAEGKLGEYARASERLEGVIRALCELGVTGLELGAAYETRARIAIWASDNAAIEEYGRLTAKEYRHGERSPLGARYERLMDEARRAGVQVLPQLTDFQTKLTTTFLSQQRGASGIVTARMALADSTQKRADCALRLLCETRSANAGHLYLQTAHGLELAATLGESAPSSPQYGFVRRYLAEQLDTADTATALSTGQNAVTSGVSQWLAPDGLAYHPLLLMGDFDGKKICAGVALLQITERTATEMTALQLAEAITNYLMLAGDVKVAVGG